MRCKPWLRKRKHGIVLQDVLACKIKKRVSDKMEVPTGIDEFLSSITWPGTEPGIEQAVSANLSYPTWPFSRYPGGGDGKLKQFHLLGMVEDLLNYAG